LRHLQQQTTTPDEGFVAQVATNSGSSDAKFVSSARSLSLSPPCLPPAGAGHRKERDKNPARYSRVRNRSTSLFFFFRNGETASNFWRNFPFFLKKKIAKIRPIFGERVAISLSTVYSFKDPVQEYRQLRRNLYGDARQCS
jgi:hypothetical protein